MYQSVVTQVVPIGDINFEKINARNPRKARNTHHHSLYLFVFAHLEKMNKKVKKIPKTQERHETQETPLLLPHKIKVQF
jgi:hypothetical protein